MTAEAHKRPPTPDETTGGENEFRHYTPEELVDPDGEFRFPTTVRMLKEMAYKRQIPRSRMGGRVTFRLPHIRAIAELFDEPAMEKPKRKTRAAA
ncbi:hypothetical protein ABZ312_11705 [Streptomyces sp. NPDC006207]